MPFETTRWSLIAAAGGDASAAARTALAALCDACWYPLFAYVRRRGASADDARDLAQGFLASRWSAVISSASTRIAGAFEPSSDA